MRMAGKLQVDIVFQGIPHPGRVVIQQDFRKVPIDSGKDGIQWFAAVPGNIVTSDQYKPVVDGYSHITQEGNARTGSKGHNGKLAISRLA